MIARNCLPRRKLHALQTAARRALGGIHHLKNSTMAAFVAVTSAIVTLSAMPATIPDWRP